MKDNLISNSSNYYQKTFSSINISGETWNEIESEDCNFKDCSFVDCKFNICKFIDCKFDDCILSAVVPLKNNFNDIKFTNSKIIGIDWTKANSIQNIKFTNCQLNYSNFSQLKLHKLVINSCEAKEVDFSETDLTSSDLANTDFEKSIFFKTNLTKSNLTGCKNYYIDPKNNTIKHAQFSLPEALSLLTILDISID